MWVACATGELVALPAAGGAALSSVTVERDLRDVLVESDGSLAITTFRSAEVLRVAADGSVTRRDSLTSPVQAFAPHVAWRSIQGANQSIVAVYQIEAEQSIPTGVPSAYGSISAGAGGIVASALSVMGPDGGTTATFLLDGILPVDVALSPDGTTVAVAAPGSAFLTAQGQNPVVLFGLDGTNTTPAPSFGMTSSESFSVSSGPPQTASAAATTTGSAAATATGSGSFSVSSGPPPTAASVGSAPTTATATATGTLSGAIPVPLPPSPASATDTAVESGSGTSPVAANGAVPALDGPDAATDTGNPVAVASNTPGITSNQVIAVAFDRAGHLLVQTREPAQLFVVASENAVIGAGTAITLSATSRDDSGHDIFHTGAGAQIACASCHPEGGDDGFVWTLNGDLRRTPSMRGTIEGTAPYHWPGDEADFTVLTNDVYTNRMAGAPLDPDQLSALQGWVQGIPAPPAPSWVDAGAAARGQVLFERSDTACSTCHSGAKFTNNETLDVGTGGAFQVPPLVGVSWRFPFLHDGCAQTLADRFALDGGCDTPAHGTTSQLSAEDLSDLIAYLESI